MINHILIDTDVRLTVEFSGGDISNYIMPRTNNSSIYADEFFTYYQGSWTDSLTSWDIDTKTTEASEWNLLS